MISDQGFALVLLLADGALPQVARQLFLVDLGHHVTQ